MARLLDDDFWRTPIGARERSVVTAATLAVMSVLILARLGTYALWDDEANTALYGEAVWNTGDTSAVHGDNVIMYRNAVELDGTLHNRLVAPLGYYIDSAFVRNTRSSWWARLPFALAGIGTIALLLHWFTRRDATRKAWAIAVLAMLGNISFILFARQARYYALAMLLTAGVVYCYEHRDRPRHLAVGAVLAIALLATHYLAYGGLALALAVDYLAFGRKQQPVQMRAIALVLAAQLVAGLVILSIWYPLGKEIAPEAEGSWWVNRLVLWQAMLRDANTCELGVGLLMIAAPFLYRRDVMLARLFVGIVVAVGFVSCFSPQPDGMRLGDIRYIAFLIPAFAVLSVRVIDVLPVRPIFAIALAAVAFHTTVLHRALAIGIEDRGYAMPVRSTTVAYLRELLDPPRSSYAATAAWLRTNTHSGETAVVFPDYASYPLMFHAPALVYGWQVTEARAHELGVPPIQVTGAVAPDWIVAFDGPGRETLRLDDGRVAHYHQVVQLPVSGVDKSRPEMYWHHFTAFKPRRLVTIWRRDD